MNKNHVSDLIPEYLDGILPTHIHKEVEQHVSNCSLCQQELEEMKVLLNVLDDETADVPSDRLRSKFLETLEAEKENQTKVVSMDSRKNSNWANNMLKIAASIALLVASFQMGSIFQQQKIDSDIATLKDETVQMRQTAMLSLMENQSASKRIQGVGFIDEFEQPDEVIIKALANRLLYDESDNVRLTAFEALSKFTSSKTVTNVFVDALAQEKNPSIQIGIIQELVKIQEKKAVDAMKRLLEKEETQPFVKDEIKSALPQII